MNVQIASPRPAGSATALLSIVPDVSLVLIALIVWFAPAMLPHGTMRWIGNVMVFEFVILHAAAAMILVASKRQGRARIAVPVAILSFYTLLAGWISYGIGAWWPIVTFALLMANQFLPLLRARSSESDNRRFVIRWVTATCVWLGATLLTLIVPFPRFGLSEAVVAVLGPGGNGLWEREPHRLVVATAIYFGAVAWLEWRNAKAAYAADGGPAGAVVMD